MDETVKAQEPTSTAPVTIQFVRDEDFLTLYANNVQVETSVWDLKVIFGILDQSVQPNRVLQHTAIHLPWAQVKLIAYTVPLTLALQESLTGKINVPESVRPPDPAASTHLPLWVKAWAEMPPELREKISGIYREFMANL